MKAFSSYQQKKKLKFTRILRKVSVKSHQESISEFILFNTCSHLKYALQLLVFACFTQKSKGVLVWKKKN